MPPQRSQRVAFPHGLSDRPAKLVRNQRGYRKHRSGFLNVEPVGSEIEVGRKNIRDSPLLRLPPEIRNRIWSFALGESSIKMLSRPFRRTATDEEYTRWNLLRVCRQIYVETAMMPYTSSTFLFADIDDVSRYLKSPTLQRVQTIHFGAWWVQMTTFGHSVCARFFRFIRSDKVKSLRKVKVTLYAYGSDEEKDSEAAVSKAQELLKTNLPGKEVEVCWGNYLNHLRYWEQS